MDDVELAELQRERTIAGQHELANAMRALVRRSAPVIFEAVRQLDDRFFLEPALFTHFAKSERDSVLGLPQLLFGRLPLDARPDAIEVDSDRRGRVHLPGIGVMLTEQIEKPLTLKWSRTDGRLSLFRDREGVCFILEPPALLSGTDIELVRYEDPTLRTRFFDTNFALAEVELEGRADLHRRNIERALELLREHCPAYTEELLRVTRRIAVFRGENINSFATINAHGVAFFNARDEHDEVYFVDELVHQCGHIIFNAMTVRRRDFLATDPESRSGGPRTLYDILHGLFTENAMSQCMRIFDERQVFSGKKAHELFGRLSFIARKFRIDLNNMSAPEILTPLGQEMYRHWRACFELIFQERPELFETDMRGQPYNFDRELFISRNPR